LRAHTGTKWVGMLVGWLVGWLVVGWSVGRLVGWLVGRLVGLVGWLVGWLGGRLVSWLVDWLVSNYSGVCLTSHADSSSASDPRSAWEDVEVGDLSTAVGWGFWLMAATAVSMAIALADRTSVSRS